MKFKKIFSSTVYFCFAMVVASSFMPALMKPAYADYTEDLREKTADFTKNQAGTDSSYLLKPVSKITFQGYHYSDYQKYSYCFDNSEGRCLTHEYNLFTTLQGNGQFKDSLYFFYKTELNEDGKLRIKKAYGLLKTGIWSWEVGKDTIWMGPGYRGSFLLSNNAEGFLLVRIRTEEPFRFPWILSSLGEFKYDVFRGWSDNSGVLGQRLSWRPMSLLEFGANQVVYIPSGKDYKVYEYPRVLFSSSDNSGSQQNDPYNNDQKASLDITLDMPFLNKITPLKNGKIYAEYGGNDSYALWQKEDRSSMEHEPLWKKLRWPFQFDFLNIGWLTGLFLTTGDIEFRFEFAQNYASYPLFYDIEFADRRHGPWYGYLNTRDGQIMGHAMGNDADDLFVEFVIRRNPLIIKIDFDQRRRGLDKSGLPPEYRYQYGISPSYQFKTFKVFSDLIYNNYRNVNVSKNPVGFDIQPGLRRDEFIAGLGIEISL